MLGFKKLSLAIFLLIILLTTILRLYRLDSFPVGFHIDEASLGYNGYSLLLTGKDEHGNRFPLYIDMFGDQRPSGYHYLTIIPIKFFGLTEFATRLPGALFGIFSIIAIFVLTDSIFKNKKIGFIASFLLAISPWHIVLSRASAETIVALFLIMLGFGLILFGIRNKSSVLVWSGSLSLTLSFFFYHTPRVFVPLVFLMLIVLAYKWFKLSRYFKSLFIAFLFVSLVSFSLVFVIKGGSGRFNQVNIFTSPSTKLIYEEQIREDGVLNTSPFFSRLSHNKVVSYSKTYLSNYLDYFSPNFLFMNGGLPIWYKIPDMGLLYVVELPFILLGLFYLFIKKDFYYRFLVFWIILAPMTAAVTVDDIPNIQRAIVLFPVLEIVAAFGIYTFFVRYKKFAKYIFIALVLIFSFNVYYFLHQYFVQSQVHRTWYRNNGFKQMVQTVNKSYNSYDSIIVTKAMGGVYPLVLFYAKYDPATYQKEGSPKDKDYGGFGKFFFVPQDCPSVNKDSRFPNSKRTIYVDRGDCPVLKVQNPTQKSTYIYREDGTKAFRIVYENSVE